MRAPRRLLALLGTSLVVLVAPAAAGTGIVLSNEATVTQWAHPKSRAVVRLNPDASSRPVARLHPRTEDGLPEVYLALQQVTDGNGVNLDPGSPPDAAQRPHWLGAEHCARHAPDRPHTAGCDILRLGRLMPVGTPVLVL